jgi:hypothetical protein
MAYWADCHVGWHTSYRPEAWRYEGVQSLNVPLCEDDMVPPSTDDRSQRAAAPCRRQRSVTARLKFANAGRDGGRKGDHVRYLHRQPGRRG